MDQKAENYLYETEVGIYKKQIDDRIDPSKNHPIHDAVERISYAAGRFDIILVLDGVSESKSDRKLVPIGRMLSWDLARFCQDETPEELQPFIEWFQATTSNPKYQGKGNTTVVFLRFDRDTGRVDGFVAGDSVALLAVDRMRPSDSGDPELRCLAEVLAPLHCVANYPGVIYNGWRYGAPFQPDPFHFQLPDEWENAYLVGMSDGYGKISDAVASELYDYNEADQILAQRFPDFARVYLPASLHQTYVPTAPRDPDGRVLRTDIAGNEELAEAIARYYDEQATPDEQRELEVIDLDCVGLRRMIKQPLAEVSLRDRDGETILEASHKSLQWMRQARYMDHEDELGLEEYLRQYVMAELFVEAMISDMYDASGGADPLHVRLHRFGEGLGPVGDDFSVAVIKISRCAG